MSRSPDIPLAHDNSYQDHANAVVAALAIEDPIAFREALRPIHPADFSDQFEQLSADQRASFIARAGELITPDVLAELEDEVVEDILPLLPNTQIAKAIEVLDNDDATRIVEEMEDTQRADILDKLDDNDRATLEASFTFDEETIGRLMQREFVAAPPFWTVGDTVDHLRAQGDDLPDSFYNIWIVDTRFHPIGYIPLSRLIQTDRTWSLTEVMTEGVITVTQQMDQEEAAFIFEKYSLISAPVIDEAGRIVGMMTVDDIVSIIQDENKEDLLALAGVNDAGLTDTVISTVKARAPWLGVNLITAMLASLVIAQFDFAIAKVVALAVLMPIVASMGGNAGTQTLAVAVRALSERELTSQTAWRAVRREAMAGLVNGLIFAAALGLIAYIWFSDLKLAFVAFFAMIVNHIFAALAGILVPLGLKRAGADPAVASSVFVTTVTDIIGFFAFLGIAALYLL